MTDYATLLNNSGLKATFQRMNILEKIEVYGHMSIDTIYAEVIKTHPSLVITSYSIHYTKLYETERINSRTAFYNSSSEV